MKKEKSNKNRFTCNWYRTEVKNSERAKELEWYEEKRKIQAEKEKLGIWITDIRSGIKTKVFRKGVK